LDRQQLLKEHHQKMKEINLAYMRFVNSEDGKIILEDLASVCFQEKSTYSDIPHKMGVNEGLRLAYMHIQKRAKPPQQQPEEKPKEGEK